MKDHKTGNDSLQDRSSADVTFRTVDDILEYYSSQTNTHDKPSEEAGR